MAKNLLILHGMTRMPFLPEQVPQRPAQAVPSPPTRQLVRNHSYDPLWHWESSLIRAGHLDEELTYPGIVEESTLAP